MPSGSTRNSLVVVHTASLDPDEVETRTDFAVTTPTRTLLDLAAAPDITQEQLDTMVADAHYIGLLQPSDIRRRMDEFGDFAALRLERSLWAAVDVST
jgi:hypothetical protein